MPLLLLLPLLLLMLAPGVLTCHITTASLVCTASIVTPLLLLLLPLVAVHGLPWLLCLGWRVQRSWLLLLLLLILTL